MDTTEFEIEDFHQPSSSSSKQSKSFIESLTSPSLSSSSSSSKTPILQRSPDIPTENTNIFSHVFMWNEFTKTYISNGIQYLILSLIPIILLNKSIQHMIPRADNKKGSVEILMEILAQMIMLFLGMMLIHRLVCYIPRFSGVYTLEESQDLPLIIMMIPFLVIVLSLQTKMGEKVDILYRRLMEYITGKSPDSYHDTEYGKQEEEEEMPSSMPQIRVRQPISIDRPQLTEPRQGGLQPQGGGGMDQGGSTSISSLPNMQYAPSLGGGQTGPPPHASPQSSPPNFDAMFQEPMASNAFLNEGFSSF